MTYSPKTTFRHALTVAWSAHLAALDQYLPALSTSKNSEDLHQFRVALRKTRALLTLFRHAIPGAGYFKDDFKWLAAATGEVRDIDVLLAHAQQQVESSAASKAASTPIITALNDQRLIAQKNLDAIISSIRTRNFIASWRQFLATLPGRMDLPPTADIPAWSVINVLVIKNSRRLLQEGLAVDADTAPPALHELRIRGKRLRYLLESFDLSTKKHRVGPLIKKLRKLQTVLGEHQDGIVAAERWQQLAKTLGNRKATTPATLGLLKEWLVVAQTQQLASRAAFAKALTKFAHACQYL